jgi:hypothetical protein
MAWARAVPAVHLEEIQRGVLQERRLVRAHHDYIEQGLPVRICLQLAAVKKT